MEVFVRVGAGGTVGEGAPVGVWIVLAVPSVDLCVAEPSTGGSGVPVVGGVIGRGDGNVLMLSLTAVGVEISVEGAIATKAIETTAPLNKIGNSILQARVKTPVVREQYK